MNVSANELQKERQQMLPSDTGKREQDESLRLPTVLEIRARRLVMIGSD
ncbi:hypothetical protein F442_02283 [Phytophthora nicotianae P10297]|nr:hypothetical protein F442_02283 [Phytophthora nicotianae P10297]